MCMNIGRMSPKEQRRGRLEASGESINKTILLTLVAEALGLGEASISCGDRLCVFRDSSIRYEIIVQED